MKLNIDQQSTFRAVHVCVFIILRRTLDLLHYSIPQIIMIAKMLSILDGWGTMLANKPFQHTGIYQGTDALSLYHTARLVLVIMPHRRHEAIDVAAYCYCCRCHT